MKITNIALNDEEMPAKVTAELSLIELALLYQFVGRTAPSHVSRAANGDYRYGEALAEVADCIGGMFNRWFESGVDEFAPKFNLEKILAAKQESLREAAEGSP